MKLHNLAWGLVVTSVALGGGLGSMDDKPWIGIFAGMEGRSFDFALGADGESEIFFKKSGDRGSIHSTTLVRYLLEEQIDNRWVKRQMTEDSLESKQTPGLDQDKVVFTATYTGDTKVEILHEFDRSGVEIGMKVLESKTTNPIRLAVQVVLPDSHRNIKDSDPDLKERDLKKSVSDLRIEAVDLDGKRQKLRDLHADVKFAEHPTLKNGARTLAVQSDVFLGNEMTLQTKDETMGVLEFDQGKKIFHGFNVLWRPVPAKTADADCRLVITLK